MRYELKYIPYWGFIKISFFVNFLGGFVLGLIFALFFGFISAVVSNLPMMQEEFGSDSTPMGVMIFVLPFLYAFMASFFNTIVGLIFVFLYNIGTKFLGGFELDFEPVAQPMSTPPQPQYTQPYQQPMNPPYQTPPPPPPPPPPSIDNTAIDDEPKKDQGPEL